MRLVPLVIALVATGPAAARADGYYFTESLGGTRVHDELSRFTRSGASFRIALGMREGHWALEGWLGGLDSYTTALDDASYWSGSLLMYGADVKYLQPVSRHFQLYVRGRVSAAQTHLFDDDYAGRGLGIAAGIQLEGKGSVLGLLAWPLFFFFHKGPQMTGALWLEDGYDFYRLHGPAGRPAVDAAMTTISGGFAVGTDF
ncbi:MAG TPA: hypothetical protein VLX92_01305 [Kofleriaceae bacterium]|nr:hypothetical protein [Kofleriaceae bacterium]